MHNTKTIKILFLRLSVTRALHIYTVFFQDAIHKHGRAPARKGITHTSSKSPLSIPPRALRNVAAIESLRKRGRAQLGTCQSRADLRRAGGWVRRKASICLPAAVSVYKAAQRLREYLCHREILAECGDNRARGRLYSRCVYVCVCDFENWGIKLDGV